MIDSRQKSSSLKKDIPILFGIILILLTIIHNRLFFPLSILSLFFIFVFLITNLIILIVRIRKDSISVIITTICLTLSGLFFWIPNSEIFKSKILIEARLIDDLSSIHLILRKNGKFETIPITVFGETKSFKGHYIIDKNKIIFNDKPYDNEFIPDTLTIYGDKLILKYNKLGSPDTSFANFFKIIKNNAH